ncbi:MAG: hypothetical protein J1F31_02235 [Erysipelotrichales bacterium]|nr:hypothetical protein [Erysipelotrichales bacterium]
MEVYKWLIDFLFQLVDFAKWLFTPLDLIGFFSNVLKIDLFNILSNVVSKDFLNLFCVPPIAIFGVTLISIIVALKIIKHVPLA